MSIPRVLFLMITPFLVEILVACCNCPETTYFQYTNCGITLSNIDNGGKNLVVTDSVNISKKAYGIQVSLQINERSCAVMPKYNSLFSTANAMSCRCDDELSYLALDSIVGLKVFTINPFDTNHDALTDISEYFSVYQNGRFLTIDEFLSDPYFSTSWVFSLLLITPPSLGPDHQFRVSLELSDGRIIEASTTELILE